MFFFWKKKPKQDATVASKPDPKSVAKPAKAPKTKKPEPVLAPFTSSPDCPKCNGYGAKVSNSRYCKGRRLFVFRCSHGLKTEHLYLDCKCGFSWVMQCPPPDYGVLNTKLVDAPALPPPRELTEYEKADNALRHFFEVELCAGEGFYDELKALMIGSENLPAGVFADALSRDKKHSRVFYKKIEGSSEI